MPVETEKTQMSERQKKYTQMQAPHESNPEDFQQLMCDVSNAVKRYGKNRPGVLALGLVSVGFFLGWKLRPW